MDTETEDEHLNWILRQKMKKTKKKSHHCDLSKETKRTNHTPKTLMERTRQMKLPTQRKTTAAPQIQ